MPKLKDIRLLATKQPEKVGLAHLKWTARPVTPASGATLKAAIFEDCLAKRTPGNDYSTIVRVADPQKRGNFTHRIETMKEGNYFLSNKDDGKLDDYLNQSIGQDCPSDLRDLLQAEGFEISYDPIVDFVNLTIPRDGRAPEQIGCTISGHPIPEPTIEGIVLRFVKDLLQQLDSKDKSVPEWSEPMQTVEGYLYRLFTLDYHRRPNSHPEVLQVILEGLLKFKPFIELLVEPVVQFFNSKIKGNWSASKWLRKKPTLQLSNSLRSEFKSIARAKSMIEGLEAGIRDMLKDFQLSNYVDTAAAQHKPNLLECSDLRYTRFESIPNLLELIFQNPNCCLEYRNLLINLIQKSRYGVEMCKLDSGNGTKLGGINLTSTTYLIPLSSSVIQIVGNSERYEFWSNRGVSHKEYLFDIRRLEALLGWQETGVYDIQGNCMSRHAKSFSGQVRGDIYRAFQVEDYTFTFMNRMGWKSKRKIFGVSPTGESIEIKVPKDHFLIASMIDHLLTKLPILSGGTMVLGGKSAEHELMLAGICFDQIQNRGLPSASPLFFKTVVDCKPLSLSRIWYCAFNSHFYLMFSTQKSSNLLCLLVVPVNHGCSFGVPFLLDFEIRLPRDTRRFLQQSANQGFWKCQLLEGSDLLHYVYYAAQPTVHHARRLYAGVLRVNIHNKSCTFKSHNEFDLSGLVHPAFSAKSKQMSMSLFKFSSSTYVLLEFMKVQRILLVHWKGNMHMVTVDGRTEHDSPFPQELYSPLTALGVHSSSTTWLYSRKLPSGHFQLYRLRYKY